MSENHAVQNATGWADTIRQMVAALEVDYDRLEELRDERQALAEVLTDDDAAESQMDKMNGHERAHAELALREWDESNAEELRELTEAATVDGEEFKSADDVRERIRESPLSIEVRSGWYEPGAERAAPEEFQILLSTGGPALRIMGELSAHGEPHRAWLEYQGWGTPWTHHYVEGLGDVLLTFCQQFYFGEGS